MCTTRSLQSWADSALLRKGALNYRSREDLNGVYLHPPKKYYFKILTEAKGYCR